MVSCDLWESEREPPLCSSHFFPPSFPPAPPKRAEPGGVGGGEGGGETLAHRSQCWVVLWLGDETQARRSPVQGLTSFATAERGDAAVMRGEDGK